MTPRLKVCVSHNVVSRISQIKYEVVGSLFGHFYDGTLFVVGFGLPTISEKDESSDGFVPTYTTTQGLQNQLATEIDLCGVVTVGVNIDNKRIRNQVNVIIQAVDVTDNPILMSCVGEQMKTHIFVNEKLEEIESSTIKDAQLSSFFIHIRLQAYIPLYCGYLKSSCKEAFDVLKKKVEENSLAFHFPQRKVLLTYSETNTEFNIIGLTPDEMVKDLLDSPSSGGKREDNCFEVLTANLLMRQTVEHDEVSHPVTAPVIHYTKDSFECIKILLKIDALSFVHRNTRVANLYNVLVSSFCRSLRLLELNLTMQLESEIFKNVSSPEIVHFRPPGLGHIFTVVYPKNAKDAELKENRIGFHKCLGLPLDQPLFRRSQAFRFPGEGPKSPLLNPHAGLISGVKGGIPSLVKGCYSYYHYMQGNYDDNGWGCAYRSLQTIVSWFSHQGLTDINIPSHKRIQECLVDIGDKPSSFIGSRQWIGSTEVSFVLESLLGIPCRILTAATGEEVASLGSELFYHFQTHGTPVMIGGGVLAHTIIGVDFNQSTDEIKFLILDPHYTGRDDISLITGKGWVGWKDSKFWEKKAFYNLCLPQRPIGDV